MFSQNGRQHKFRVGPRPGFNDAGSPVEAGAAVPPGRASCCCPDLFQGSNFVIWPAFLPEELSGIGHGEADVLRSVIIGAQVLRKFVMKSN